MRNSNANNGLTNAFLPVSLLIFLLLTGCSINKVATSSLADALAGGSGSAFSSDDDVELVCQALPLALKTMEALVEKVPDNKGLNLSLAGGFMLYTVASVEIAADKIKETDYSEYKRLRLRAQKLYYRAYTYGLQGLTQTDKNFSETYQRDHAKALALITRKEDVGLLYWTGAALAKWITFSKDDPAAVIRLPEAVEFMNRALALDPDYDNGSLYEFFTAYESRSGSVSDTARAMEYYRKAVRASEGKKLSVHLTYAECFALPFQDKKAFNEHMRAIMDFDLNTQPAFKLANALTRRRAELLQAQEDNLFLGE